ncbi:hypothetical protein D7M15_15780 [Streptomyces sp. Z26]|nr:hypothetical protein D7M15_15780 [Streptomyces sp. Z26]
MVGMLAAMSAVPTPSAPREPASRRERDDACPGTLRLHTADDGALARVRIPGGLLTATQADALADAADRLGDGALHLTSRGNVQLRGLGRGDTGGLGGDAGSNGCGRELADTLAEIGLLPSARHERVRNIVASPLSGLDGRGHLDVAPWVRELDRLLCASAAAAGLSGRFLFACDDGRGDVAALGADVTLVARDAETAELRIDGVSPDTPSGQGDGLGHGPGRDEPGGTAVLHVSAAEAPRAALLAAELFLAAVRDGGTPCWRVRELPGAAALMARGVTRRLRTARELAEPHTQVAPDAVREPGAAPGLHPAPDSAPGTRTARAARTALCVTAPLGRLTTDQWRRLAATAARDGDGRLRVTPWRGVVVPGLPGAPSRTAPDRLAELADAGLVTGPYAPLAGVGACAGRPGCAKSRTDVRGHAVRAADAEPAEPSGARALPVHWSGCERRCGHPQGGAWVDVVATPGGYDVTVVGGPVRAPAATAVTDPARLAAAVAAARTTGPPP